MNNAIIVEKHPETGAVITENVNNKDFGTIRVSQEVMSISGRIINRSVRQAFLTGPKKALEAMNLYPGAKLPIEGKLVVKESLTPFYDGQAPKIATGTTVQCTKEGKPIYRQVEFSQDPNESDVKIQHDNTDEIKAAQANVLQQVGTTTIGE